MKAQVGVVRTAKAEYPNECPYHPSEAYPEYPFQECISRETNSVYAGIRQLLLILGFDPRHQGTSKWNPLGHIIEPGMTVVIKPNFVRSRHFEGKDPFSMITHPSVLRAISDYCWIALEGDGKIVIADAPQYDCNFSELLEVTKLQEVCDFYAGFAGPSVEVLDLRNYWSKKRHFPSMIIDLPGDPQGSVTVNLGKKSALYSKPHPEKLYGAVYHRSELVRHHSEERQEYEISRTILNADVVISVPKLKVHKKVGVTLNTKGLVGIATNKNLLVHYTLTPPSEGGDQYPDGLLTRLEEALIKIERWMYDHLLAPRVRPLEYLHRSMYWLHNHTTRRLGIKVDENKRLLDAGNWYGNDSAWRMAVDLMKAFHFADREGHLHRSPQRRVFSVIDGVIGGDNKGPLVPDPVLAGVLLAGENFLAVDLVAARLMGFDPLKVRMYRSLLADPEFDFGVRRLDDIQVVSPNRAWVGCLQDTTSRFLDFDPHPGWIGHLEIQPKGQVLAFPTPSHKG